MDPRVREGDVDLSCRDSTGMIFCVVNDLHSFCYTLLLVDDDTYGGGPAYLSGIKV
jgi:hypothetical protein